MAIQHNGSEWCVLDTTTGRVLSGHPTFEDAATHHTNTEDDEHVGITEEGQALGHRYIMGNVNAYCPQCTAEHSQREGRTITVLDCDYDQDK